MGFLSLLTNTIEGAAEVAVNTAKLVVSPLAAPFDEGQAMADSAEGIRKGVGKIGNASDEPPTARSER